MHVLMQCKNATAANGLYHRIDPRLPRQISLDDVTAMQVLILLCTAQELFVQLVCVEQGSLCGYPKLFCTSSLSILTVLITNVHNC